MLIRMVRLLSTVLGIWMSASVVGVLAQPPHEHERTSNPIQVQAIVPLPRLRVEGNRIVDSQGHLLVLHGVNLGDPLQLEKEGRWKESYLRAAAEWNAKLVRVPVHPAAYREAGREKFLQFLDDAVDWSERNGMYVIIDWHSIGNPIQGVFLDPPESYRTDRPEMRAFWQLVAQRYKDRTAAAFFEVFNEPAAITWKNGRLDWSAWRDLADEMVDVIYAENPHAIPIVGGLEFACDFREFEKAPLRNKGVVYAAHPYPGNIPQPWEENWESYFGFLAREHPVMLTEFGFDPHDTIFPKAFQADVEYGKRIVAYAQARNISWTAFVFYKGPYWPMPLFEDWESLTPTESGTFFRAEMQRRK